MRSCAKPNRHAPAETETIGLGCTLKDAGSERGRSLSLRRSVVRGRPFLLTPDLFAPTGDDRDRPSESPERS